MHNLNPQLQPQPQPFYARARITLACLPLRLVGEGRFFFGDKILVKKILTGSWGSPPFRILGKSGILSQPAGPYPKGGLRKIPIFPDPAKNTKLCIFFILDYFKQHFFLTKVVIANNVPPPAPTLLWTEETTFSEAKNGGSLLNAYMQCNTGVADTWPRTKQQS